VLVSKLQCNAKHQQNFCDEQYNKHIHRRCKIHRQDNDKKDASGQKRCYNQPTHNHHKSLGSADVFGNGKEFVAVPQKDDCQQKSHSNDDGLVYNGQCSCVFFDCFI